MDRARTAVVAVAGLGILVGVWIMSPPAPSVSDAPTVVPAQTERAAPTPSVTSPDARPANRPTKAQGSAAPVARPEVADTDIRPPFPIQPVLGEEQQSALRAQIIASADVFVAQLRDQVRLSDDQADALTELLRNERMEEFDLLQAGAEDEEGAEPHSPEAMQAVRDATDEAVTNLLDPRQREAYDALRRPAPQDTEEP